MTACPYARWDPLAPKMTQPKMRSHDIVCLHTMAGFFNGTNAQFHAEGYGGLESHFGIAADGRAHQWVDTEHVADANGAGNPRIISIETEDHGPDFAGYWKNGSDVPPWTPNQLDKIVQIVRWACDLYDIPKELVPDSKPSRRGIAYHRQGIDPWRVSGGEFWSKKSGKVCPGDRRIHQIETIVIPRVQEDEDMSAETVAEGVELALKSGGRARDDMVTLVIGALVTGLRQPGDKPKPGEGDLRPIFKQLLTEVLDERG